jgi:hypothetical protein
MLDIAALCLVATALLAYLNIASLVYRQALE